VGELKRTWPHGSSRQFNPILGQRLPALTIFKDDIDISALYNKVGRAGEFEIIAEFHIAAIDLFSFFRKYVDLLGAGFLSPIRYGEYVNKPVDRIKMTEISHLIRQK
jgi:hypothetical protein